VTATARFGAMAAFAASVASVGVAVAGETAVAVAGVGVAPAAALAPVAAPAGEADRSARATAARELAPLSARLAVLDEQAEAARAAVRWRLRALQRLAAGGTLEGAVHARAVDAGTRVLARDLAEARSLARERDQLRGERDALAALADEAIGPAPSIGLPVAGAALARFGVAPEPGTGLLVARAGVRLAATPAEAVRAPVTGVVGRVAAEPEGAAVVIDAGAGWTAIVGGLASADVVAGQRVVAGAPLGRANAVVSFELWRGLHPVDPLLLARAPAPPASEALADPPRLP
jgi:murein DD-endopeptidase MepM/ murein hydrolase activator NlpD